MNRDEFLAKLESLLAGMPEEERKAAVQYYADYFADAGEENEAEVIRELGSPEKTAESIRADFYGFRFREEAFDQKNYMEKSGTGAERSSGTVGRTGEERNSGTAGGAGRGNQYAGNSGRRGFWEANWWKVLLVVLAAVVLWPLTAAVLSVLLAAVLTVVCVFAGLVAAAAGIMLAGAVTVLVGAALFAIPPAGMVVAGIGILLFVLGLVSAAGSVKLCMIVYPAMFRGAAGLFRRVSGGKAVQQK